MTEQIQTHPTRFEVSKWFGPQTAQVQLPDDALNAMRFLPAEVTNAIETSLARVYEVDSDELSSILFPEE